MHWSEEKIPNMILIRKKQLLPYLICLTTLILITQQQVAAASQLSDSAKISILTCGPGAQLYAGFGHTALRFSDPVNKIDEVFNYGTFYFDTPNFYTRFLSGKLDYSLSVSDFEAFILEYKMNDRWIREQELLFETDLVQKIYDSINRVLLPENNFYRYDFFRNNCSTKVMDIVLAFTANNSIIDTLEKSSGKTFRQALKPYLVGQSWLNIGINMLLGPYADQTISKLQSTYLPENLMNVIGQTGIAANSRLIGQGSYMPAEAANPNFAMILFWILLFGLVIEALWSKTSQKISDKIDVVLFSIVGLFGILFIILWFLSDHVAFHVNLNLLWANPFNFLVVWSITNAKAKVTRVYLILYTISLFYILINWGRLPQKFPLELMPVVTAIIFRAINRIFKFKRNENSKIIDPQVFVIF